MRAAFETVARAAKGHGKGWGSAACARISSSRAGCCGSACYLTGGSDVGYILSAGRTDVKQLRELKL
jgi:hypothetical protein